jgi:hypothetical protein
MLVTKQLVFRRFWYPVVPVVELQGGLTSFELLGESISSSYFVPSYLCTAGIVMGKKLVQLGVSSSTIENFRTEMGFPSSSRNGGEISATLY